MAIKGYEYKVPIKNFLITKKNYFLIQLVYIINYIIIIISTIKK